MQFNLSSSLFENVQPFLGQILQFILNLFHSLASYFYFITSQILSKIRKHSIFITCFKKTLVCIFLGPGAVFFGLIIILLFMNTGSPNIVRSQRAQLINRSVQTLQVYSCQLYIDSFKISYRGFVYFLWASETTQIQSLKYESNGKTIPVKQTLTIGVRITSKNGKQQPLHTYLKLMDDQGQELDQFEIQINGLTTQFKQMEVPMDRGLCILKMRRRQMKINEQMQRSSYKGLYRSNNTKYDQKQGVVGSEYDSLQEQLIKIKKQLQDEVYLNNKLKNDRDVLLATKQELELETERLLLQVSKEISVLREHYESRMTIREHCYEEEIQNLVYMFNVQNQQTRKVMEFVLKQKNRAEDEAKSLVQKNKKAEWQISQKNQNISQCQLKINGLMQTISQLQLSVQTLTKEKQLQITHSSQLKTQIFSLNSETTNKNHVLKEYEQRIAALELRIQEYQHLLNCKDQQRKQLQNLHAIQTQSLQQQNNKLLLDLDALKAKLDQHQSQLQFNQNVIKQLKQQNHQKQTELYQQIQNIQHLYNKKIEDLMFSFQFQRQNQYNYNELLLRQKAQLEEKVIQLSNIVQQSEFKIRQLKNQIICLQNEIQNNKASLLAKDQQIFMLQKEIELLKTQLLTGKNGLDPNQIAKYEEKIAMLEAQLHKTKLLLQQKQRMLKQVRDEMLLLQKRLRGQRNEVQVSQQIDKISIDLSSQLNRMSESGMYNLLNQKQQQINALKRRVRELQKLEEDLRNKLNSIQTTYPEIVVPQISDEEEESEENSEEQKYLKRTRKSKRQIIQQPIINRVIEEVQQPVYRQERRLSIGNQFTERISRTSIKNQIVRSQKKIVQDPRVSQTSHRQISYHQIQNKVQQISNREPSHHQTAKESQKSRRVIPRPPSLKIKKLVSTNSIKDDHSLLSVASGIRVSHSKKSEEKIPSRHRRQSIDKSPKVAHNHNKSYQHKQHQKSYRQQSIDKSPKTPHNQINLFQDKPHQRSYIRQIQSYQDEIRQLRAQLSNLRKSKSYNNNTQNQTLGSFFFKSPVIQLKKVSTESQVFLEDERGKSLDHQQLQIMEIQLQKKNMRIGQLQDQIKQLRKIKDQNDKLLKQLYKLLEEKQKQIVILNDKLSQKLRRQEENNRKTNEMLETIKKMQKLIGQLEGELAKERQVSQQTKRLLKQTTQHYQNAQTYIKKLKAQIQTLQEKLRRAQGNELVINNLKTQLGELEKKLIEMTKVNNHFKLQNDSLEEQLRILKKKQNQQARLVSELQEKTSSLERVIQQSKRKETTLKRQIEQNQQQVRRAKTQTKKLQQELQTLGSAQIGWQMQKRKYLDQINSLHDQLSRKEYELGKLNKQMDKIKFRADQTDDLRGGKKNQLLQQIQQLQSELMRKQKNLFQQSQQNKLLRARLQLLERQNQRIVEYQNHNFGQKIKYYIQEMADIKKLLDSYQSDNTRLKVQNSTLYEQYYIMQSDYQKLQVNYNQQTGRQQDILFDLQLSVTEVNALKQRVNIAGQEIQRLNDSYEKLSNQNNEQKQQARKTLQKLQNTQANLEEVLDQLRQLKSKQSGYQVLLEFNNKNEEKYKLMEKQKLKLEQEYRKIKLDFDNAVNIFVYKRQDLEKAVNQVRQKEKKAKQEEIQKITKEYNKNVLAKTQRFEQEFLQIYNQNSKLKVQIHATIQENGRQKGRLTEIQAQHQKIKAERADHELNKRALQQLRQELKKKNDKLSKLSTAIQELTNDTTLKQKLIKEHGKTIQRMSEQIHKLKRSQRQLQEALAKTTQRAQKERAEKQLQTLQRETQITKQYQIRINSLEMQIQMLKEKEAKIVEENSNKIKKQKKRLDEMQSILKQKQKAIQLHYKQEIRDLQTSLIRLSQELQDKLMRNNELNEVSLILEHENNRLVKQNGQLKQNGEQNRRQFQNQLAKLHQKMKAAENGYSKSIKILEEELAKITQTKHNSSNSRIKANDIEERIAKRYEQKLNHKDEKINELKDGIAKLQQSMFKLKKKQANYQTTTVQLQKAKLLLSELQKQKKRMRCQLDAEIKRNNQLVKDLRKQILKSKQEEQKAKLGLDQKTLKYDSICCELKTLKQLYAELQKELGKRHTNLAMQMDEESTLQYKLKMQQNKIDEAKEKLSEEMRKVSSLELQLRKRNNDHKQQLSAISQLKQVGQQQTKQINKLKQQLLNLQQSLHEANLAYQSSKDELKQSRIQICNLKKNQQDLKTMCQTKQQISVELKKQNEYILSCYRQCQKVVQKYSLLSSRSRQEIGCELEQIFQKYSILLEEKDDECNQMIEEIEELKFLNQRKHIDYDDIKRLSFQMQLKAQECQTLSRQLQNLRRVCDRLQQQKKNSIFRQQVLRLKLQNLARSGPAQLRSRIQGILFGQNVAYGSFSFS